MPRALIFGMQHHLVVPYQDCSNYGSGVKIGPAPGVTVLHRLIQGKHIKIFSSKTTMPTALIFGMQHHLVVPYKDCSYYAPEVKIGPAPGVTVLHRLIQGKHIKIFFSITTMPRALIYGMQHHLVVPYQDCSNYAPEVKIDPAPGVTSFYIYALPLLV